MSLTVMPPVQAGMSASVYSDFGPSDQSGYGARQCFLDSIPVVAITGQVPVMIDATHFRK